MHGKIIYIQEPLLQDLYSCFRFSTVRDWQTTDLCGW